MPTEVNSSTQVLQVLAGRRGRAITERALASAVRVPATTFAKARPPCRPRPCGLCSPLQGRRQA